MAHPWPLSSTPRKPEIQKQSGGNQSPRTGQRGMNGAEDLHGKIKTGGNPDIKVQTWTATRCTLLRDFVQGWFLLQESGLETSEKNLILAALKGECSFDRVAQELRNQWNEDDLKRRDQGGRSVSAWMADEGDDHHPFEADHYSPDLNLYVQSGMNAEGMALMSETEDEAQSALALMERGRRTLREVKMSRQYYGTSGKGVPFTKSHRTADCLSKSKPQASAVDGPPSDQAPFLCMTHHVLSADGGGVWKLSTQDAIKERR